jgi:hypothetical protein
MLRRAYIIATVALGLTLTAIHTPPLYGHLKLSAHNFRHYLHDLNKEDSSLNPVERILFSLALTGTKSNTK